MVVVGLCMFVAVVAIVGILVTPFPIIKLHNETLTWLFLAARFTEVIMFTIGALLTLSLLSLAREYVATGKPNAAYYQTFGTVIRETSDAAFDMGTVIIFSLSTIILGIIFYQTKLVPHWLAAWKLIGGT